MDHVARIRVVDSHTGGEPTRVVLEGGPDLGHGPLSERVRVFRERYDHLSSAMVCEPRGSDTVVGALLTPPSDASCVAGVIYFNNVGYLGMCGHGTIGLVATLAWLGRIVPGVHRIDTPVGVVSAELGADGLVHVENVPAYRHARDIAVTLDDGSIVRGDVAWGGNWFFLVREPARDREVMGENISKWIKDNAATIEIVDKIVTQSSDKEFHCLSITLFYKSK